MWAEVKAEIQGAVDRAEEQMQILGDPLDMFAHVYAEATPELKLQRATLVEELAAQAKEETHG